MRKERCSREAIQKLEELLANKTEWFDGKDRLEIAEKLGVSEFIVRQRKKKYEHQYRHVKKNHEMIKYIKENRKTVKELAEFFNKSEHVMNQVIVYHKLWDYVKRRRRERIKLTQKDIEGKTMEQVMKEFDITYNTLWKYAKKKKLKFKGGKDEEKSINGRSMQKRCTKNERRGRKIQRIKHRTHRGVAMDKWRHNTPRKISEDTGM